MGNECGVCGKTIKDKNRYSCPFDDYCCSRLCKDCMDTVAQKSICQLCRELHCLSIKYEDLRFKREYNNGGAI